MNQSRLPMAQPGYNRTLVPPQPHLTLNMASKCFYCHGTAHRVAECEHALKLGWVIKNANGIRLPNGQNIPRDGMKTMKEVIEDLNKPKPGLIQMSRIPDKTALYQENGRATSYVQSEQTDEDNIRALTELIQKVGVDRLQEILTPQNPETLTEEDNAWLSNFE